MKIVVVAVVAVLLVVPELALGFIPPSTAPAFLWSPHEECLTANKVKDAVSYQTLSPKDLANSVMSEGGWSNLLCAGRTTEHPVDLALVFLGRELRSSDISARKHEDQALVDLLKASFTKSKFSLAFPYVAASEEKETLQNSLVSEFAKTCGHDAGLRKLAILDTCAAQGGNFEKLTDINSVHDYLVSSMEKKSREQTPVVVFCHGGADSSEEFDHSRSEGEVFSELISSVEQTGATYSVLYVSDPARYIRYPSYRQVDRFLAEKAGNKSDNSTTCDEVCQIKSSLLEGLLVGLVLLIILISGLCCMAGIDTPTRFEAPQDS